METSEALNWTRQQQQKIDMDPEQQLYTPKIENDCCDRDAWRHLKLFVGHGNNNNNAIGFSHVDICLLYKPSQDLEADIFTKDLSRDQMKKHLENLSIVGIKTK
ncbi:hypothetical protein LAZ67_15003344 [Cordylochernes scorpioides]|uniref:Uncharacterized protein n=1 Tax=Cordylochernes scorpioides TaxID=51811 RepID=A0ABY6LEF1_9ARAC|nr:hypothetical protein LAZ67_15003344 [Cordylochernes scorpioides]